MTGDQELGSQFPLSDPPPTSTSAQVKLTDVYPSGYSALIQDGVVRMRWRNDGVSTVPQPMAAGATYAVTVDLWYTSYIWAAGHRIRVDVSSSNYPRFSVNPNTGAPVSPHPATANATAANVVFFGAPSTPSAVVLPVVNAATQLPRANLTAGRPGGGGPELLRRAHRAQRGS